MGRTKVGYQLAFSRVVPTQRAFACLILVASVACGGGSSSHDGAGGASTPSAGGARANGGKSGATGATGGRVSGFGGGENAGEGGAPDQQGGAATTLGGRNGAGGSNLVPLGGFFSGGAANGGKGSGGRPSGGASSGGQGSGGFNGCIDGAPCTCGTLGGVTQCSAMGSSCSCPPAEQCKAPGEAAPCFEPCGGDPFGSWVLADSCLRGKDSSLGCERSLVGTPGANDLRIRILDGGEVEMAGTELWTVEAKATVGCLSVSSVNSCKNEKLYVDPTLFSSFSRLECAANACGVCDCKGSATSVSGYETSNWTRQATELNLGSRIVPYCVKGDELWLGGGSYNGELRAAYKFKKKSCVGKPLACSLRTSENCAVDGTCNLGACKATGGGSTPRCAAAYSQEQCGVLQGCAWDASGCSGPGPEQCNIANCEKVPGCSWGDPVERCGGQALDCSSRNPTQDDCTGGGCSLTTCQASDTETVDCKKLTTTADCMKAPGCTVNTESTTSTCTGAARCTAQTDSNVCSKLGCEVFPACVGTTVQCSTLTLAKCHDVPGCRLEW